MNLSDSISTHLEERVASIESDLKAEYGKEDVAPFLAALFRGVDVLLADIQRDLPNEQLLKSSLESLDARILAPTDLSFFVDDLLDDPRLHNKSFDPFLPNTFRAFPFLAQVFYSLVPRSSPLLLLLVLHIPFHSAVPDRS